VRRIEGDLVAMAREGHFDVIVHGCNCFCDMEAGIAKAIAKAFPEALDADRATEAGDRAKLGTLSVAEVDRDGARLAVVNAYTQYDFRGRGRKVDYDAVTSCFEETARGFPEARIGYPMIGAGLAGGDWSEIASRIDRALGDRDHCLVVLPE
jgi:O-acetyl-ADP-ribose deacetylase (regulator of RNase III)